MKKWKTTFVLIQIIVSGETFSENALSIFYLLGIYDKSSIIFFLNFQVFDVISILLWQSHTYRFETELRGVAFGRHLFFESNFVVRWIHIILRKLLKTILSIYYLDVIMFKKNLLSTSLKLQRCVLRRTS